MLVAVVMLFVIGAMAALSIDVVTLYTARSEAQLAADAAALAAARVLANSGATSDPNAASDGLMSAAQTLATNVATQVAEQNQVGGAYLTGVNITAPTFGGTYSNPTVTVSVQVTNLPTFFARIWGRTNFTVAASATAEAYNPSGASALGGTTTPVAPMCVKPWLLPNRDPSNGNAPIFDPVSGTINAGSTLLGWSSGTPTTGLWLRERCGNCAGPPAPLDTWRYYPGDTTTTFPPPSQALPVCTPPLTTDYQKGIAGCIDTPISCNSSAKIDVGTDFNRNLETADAVNCLTHATANPSDADQVDPTVVPSPPFEFLAGTNNPITGSVGKDVMTSDSLVTVPVFDVGSFAPPSNTVTIVGFVQLFLNSNGTETPNNGRVYNTVINMVGCGTGASGQPILGNGASPVAVRLISP